nr:hypothetical protein [uncultured Desulfosarcina sp.]
MGMAWKMPFSIWVQDRFFPSCKDGLEHHRGIYGSVQGCSFPACPATWWVAGNRFDTYRPPQLFFSFEGIVNPPTYGVVAFLCRSQFADLRSHLVQGLAFDDIVGPVAAFFSFDQTCLAQYLKMLGYGWLGYAEMLGQCTDTQIVGSEQL